MSDGVLRKVLFRYGEVKDIQAEKVSLILLPRGQWHSTRNDYSHQHIPSHIAVAGNRALVSYDGQPMTCYGCNDKGHVYQADSLSRRVQEAARTSTCADIAKRGTGKTMQVSEDEQWTALHSEQPELARRDYEERCASHPLGGGSDLFDQNVRNQAVKCSSETLSIPAHTTLEPASKVAVRVENTELAVEERREAVMLPVKISQKQETHEVT